MFADTLVATQDGLADLYEVWRDWTSGPEFPYGAQIGGYAPWLSGEDRCRVCPTCERPMRVIAWIPEHVIAGPRSRERDFALFVCGRDGCDPRRVQMSYERDG